MNKKSRYKKNNNLVVVQFFDLRNEKTIFF